MLSIVETVENEKLTRPKYYVKFQGKWLCVRWKDFLPIASKIIQLNGLYLFPLCFHDLFNIYGTRTPHNEDETLTHKEIYLESIRLKIKTDKIKVSKPTKLKAQKHLVEYISSKYYAIQSDNQQ